MLELAGVTDPGYSSGVTDPRIQFGRGHRPRDRNIVMKIIVIGGSGLIGTKLVKLLRDGGQDVLAASRSTGVNTLTGEGLADALAGAAVVVDVTNSPSFEDRAVL